MSARCASAMKDFLQDKGHHQTATGIPEVIHRPESISAVRCPPLPPINTASAFGYGHWRFAGENIDHCREQALTIHQAAWRGRITLDSRHLQRKETAAPLQLDASPFPPRRQSGDWRGGAQVSTVPAPVLPSLVIVARSRRAEKAHLSSGCHCICISRRSALLRTDG